MHTVNRGPEPSGLGAVRRRYTPRWVSYYRDGEGDKPSDSKWRDFHRDVSSVFSSLCGYCEETCKGDVDHFRPKSKYPDSVYEWNNWVLACHVCNQKKSDNWPSVGYVNPCTRAQTARPELYFDFDTKTGEILPKKELTPGRWRKADRMIENLGLNAYHQLKQRVQWLRVVSKALEDSQSKDNEEMIAFVTSRETQLSSITRAWVQEQGLSYPD